MGNHNEFDFLSHKNTFSGAGKSTLLNILTQNKMRGMRVFGEVAINKFVEASYLKKQRESTIKTRCIFSQLVEMGDIKKYSAYVRQDDLFIAEMTVQEQLMFAVCFGAFLPKK